MHEHPLTIISRKLDGAFRFSTEVDVLHRSPTVLLALGRPGRRLRRSDGESRSTMWSLEYLPLDKPYNIVSFCSSDGVIKRHFCNVLMEQALEGDTLSYVDLDLDLSVLPDGTYEIEDRDQFEQNAREMGYSHEVRSLALASLGELVGLAKTRGHVFGCTRLEEARELLLTLYAPEV